MCYLCLVCDMKYIILFLNLPVLSFPSNPEQIQQSLRKNNFLRKKQTRSEILTVEYAYGPSI